ncbi:helix-turn-helix domain-containing protein [Nocardia sp. 004]|uniref:helix-turn-helix domain-containing protein n=1 Tax=Nocardia sp. 004 TaxID=3385978 RepID=UPI0039A0AD21
MEHLDRMVADLIRHAMSAAGLTRDELARLSGVPEEVLLDKLDAMDSFDLYELVFLAAVLDCRVADLLPEMAGSS